MERPRPRGHASLRRPAKRALEAAKQGARALQACAFRHSVIRVRFVIRVSDFVIVDKVAKPVTRFQRSIRGSKLQGSGNEVPAP